MSDRGGPPSIEISVAGIRPPPWRPRLRAFCAAVIDRLGREQGDIAILLCGDKRMTELNSRYRGIDGPTDVLSFSRPAGGAIAGDLAISMDTLARNASAYGVGRDEELRRLVIHGILHLAGMDHGKGSDGRMMRLQERLARELGGERIIR